MEGEEVAPFLVRALAPNKAKGQLEFKKGQELTVERNNSDTAMYFGFYGKKEGWFPDYFVQAVPQGKPELRKSANKPAPTPKRASTTTTVTPVAPPKPSKKEIKEKEKENAKKERAQKEEAKKALAEQKKAAKKKGSKRGSDASIEAELPIPPIIENTIAYLENPERLKLEGIFRVSGSINEVKLIKAEYMKGKKVDLTRVPDAHTIAGVLKIFFRESKDPLLTFELYDCWVAAIATPSEGDRVASVRQVIDLLPAINRRILQRLIGLLVKVAEYEQFNKMNVNNIAIVFAPTLLRPPGDQIDIAIQDSSYANHLVKFMIEAFEFLFFDTPTKSQPPPIPARDPLPAQNQISEEEFDKRLRRGSLLIAKGSMTKGHNSFVTGLEDQDEENETSDVSVDLSAEDIEEDTNPSDNDADSESRSNMSMEEMMDKILEGHVNEVDEYLATLEPELAAATKKDLLDRIEALMQSDDFKD